MNQGRRRGKYQGTEVLGVTREPDVARNRNRNGGYRTWMRSQIARREDGFTRGRSVDRRKTKLVGISMEKSNGGAREHSRLYVAERIRSRSQHIRADKKFVACDSCEVVVTETRFECGRGAARPK